ncbi:ABC transporter ATP-binding protein [Oceanispirochaeta sp.]|jgi:multiple sugar transport system ATP-binding protein|uniref:ABC transporter ATP-binding protein n=1 Tax=Oceanispirochaeta sp. TaxID=2035350 RepID=UPI0026188CEC|nr:ABC transporter ATP-binding protein [Oceanispirochaeta sp.]MDA3955083.1 ABC transporter ATP-binding protein [Oceanispirochaeta sp.]
MPELMLRNVFKRYDNKKKKSKVVNDFAVNDLSLVCNEGEFIGILGPSGCGKTTTLRMIAGLEEITGGEILIDDVVINHQDPKDRHIGLAFEDYALYPPMSVYDNIAFNLRAKKIDEAVIAERISKIAPLLKVEDLLQQKPISLSGGQKQRVNIARAIVREPKLLLLDEPLSHLDGKMRQVLRDEIKRLHKSINCTTIIVTHDQLEAMSLSDKIAIMKDGVLQQYGTPLDIYDNPSNEFVAGFIGEPPMNLLSVTIKKAEIGFLFVFHESPLSIPVPSRYNDVVHDGMKVRLGVRPTDVFIGSEKSLGSEIDIAVFESLGEERRLHFRVGDEFLTLITTDKIFYKPGDIIKLEVLSEKTHLFNIETGNKITATKN